MDLQTIQPQFQAPTSPPMQPIWEATADQDPTKFVCFFNAIYCTRKMDTNHLFIIQFHFKKSSQSLQLLFQLPNVQQTVAQQQTSTLLSTSSAPPNQTLCQTTVIQSKQNNLHAPNDTSATNPAFSYGNNALQFSVSINDFTL